MVISEMKFLSDKSIDHSLREIALGRNINIYNFLRNLVYRSLRSCEAVEFVLCVGGFLPEGPPCDPKRRQLVKTVLNAKSHASQMISKLCERARGGSHEGWMIDLLDELNRFIYLCFALRIDDR